MLDAVGFLMVCSIVNIYHIRVGRWWERDRPGATETTCCRDLACGCPVRGRQTCLRMACLSIYGCRGIVPCPIFGFLAKSKRRRQQVGHMASSILCSGDDDGRVRTPSQKSEGLKAIGARDPSLAPQLSWQLADLPFSNQEQNQEGLWFLQALGRPSFGWANYGLPCVPFAICQCKPPHALQR